jgi:DNA-binding response OmpR family regulator
MQSRILIIEDESYLRHTLTHLLQSHGYTVQSSGDGIEGQELAVRHAFDLIILDVMLPSRSGFDICRYLRWNGINTPILLLTARNELGNKVDGFKSCADDYLTKPFETPELQVRVEALLRRGFKAATSELQSYELDGMLVDFRRSRLIKNGKITVLSQRECRLLRYFIERKGIILSRDELLQEVWGYREAPLTRTVDAHISGLRRKIENDPKDPQFIVTVPTEGYRFAG